MFAVRLLVRMCSWRARLEELSRIKKIDSAFGGIGTRQEDLLFCRSLLCFLVTIFFCGGRESGQVGTFQCLVSIVTEKGGTTLTKNNMILCYPNLPSNISSVLSTRNTDPCSSQRCRCACRPQMSPPSAGVPAPCLTSGMAAFLWDIQVHLGGVGESQGEVCVSKL